jgi:hypothetical protein
VERTIAYRGRKLVIAYAVDRNGRSPAKEFFEALSPPDQAKLMRLFALLGDEGRIVNSEKFGYLVERFHEFKSFQIRMPCRIVAGSTVIVTHGFLKKKDKTPREEITRAKRIFAEDQERAGQV